MTQKKIWIGLALLITAGFWTGCSSFVAHRMAQAPNTYPQWTKPKAPVLLDVGASFLTNFPRQSLTVGPPEAKLSYRIVEPADYGVQASSTNWVEDGRPRFRFNFRAYLPSEPTKPERTPAGTVVLLHGYGLSQVSMTPWAVRLAQEGWRCVLVDLRGHGRSTGKQIYFGIRETRDLSQLLDVLELKGELVEPVMAFGQSYGAALALRWQGLESRVQSSVAIAPYSELGSAVMNIRNEYASWLPGFMIRAGLKKLPKVLGVDPAALDTANCIRPGSGFVLFVAGENDAIARVSDVARLYELALPECQLIVVPKARHEPLPFQFTELVPPVVQWLNNQSAYLASRSATPTPPATPAAEPVPGPAAAAGAVNAQPGGAAVTTGGGT